MYEDAHYQSEQTRLLASVRDQAWFDAQEALGFTRDAIEQHLTAAQSPVPVGERSSFSVPARTPLTPNLFNTGQFNVDASTRWWDGLIYEPDPCCATGGTWVECDSEGPTKPKPGPTDIPAGHSVVPFVAVTSISCTTLSRGTWAERYAQVTALHNRMLPVYAMQVLTHGGVDGQAPGALGRKWDVNGTTGFSPNPYITAQLPAGHDLTPASGAVAPGFGAKLLSAALTCCQPGMTGLIVTTPLGFETMTSDSMVPVAGGQNWHTKGGHMVLGSCGFDGRGPGTADASGLAPGEQWMYGIGLPSVQVSPIWSVSEMARQRGQVASDGWPINAINQNKNLWTAMVESTVAVTFNPCCRFAVKVAPGKGAC